MRKLTARSPFLFCLFLGALSLTAQEQSYSREALESPELYTRLYNTGCKMLGTNLMQHKGIISTANWVDFSGYEHWTCTIETGTGRYVVITDGRGFISEVSWGVNTNKNNADTDKIKDALYRGILVRGKEDTSASSWYRKAYYMPSVPIEGEIMNFTAPVMLYVNFSNNNLGFTIISERRGYGR